MQGYYITKLVGLENVIVSNIVELPRILAIDEFKGTTEKGKYQCVIGDPEGFKVLDVIQDRKLSTLKDYFRSLPTHRVQMVVMDIWHPYKILAQQLFQNPIIIVDKFHYVRS